MGVAPLSKQIKKIVVPEPQPTTPLAASEQDKLQASHHLPELTKDFIFGGKALFVVENDETGEHMTFKVRGRDSEWPKNSGLRKTNYFLNVKASGGRYAYRYVGVVNPDGTVRVTSKSDFKPEEKPYKVGAWACHAVVG